MKFQGKIKFVNNNKSEFFATLRKRVDQHFKDKKRSKYADASMVTKTIVLLLCYISPFILLLAFQPPFLLSMLLWFIMGLGIAGIGMSVMHDAIHGAYSAKKSTNTLLGYTLNLLGGSVFNWKLQHNVLHHTYTNIVELDEDIQDKLVLRFNPHGRVKTHHQLQWIYAFFFYGILTLYWVVLKDFIQFFLFTKSGVNTNSTAQNVGVLSRIILLKVVYFFVMLVVPTLVFGIPFMWVLAGFMIMHFVAGLVLTVVFQLAHTVEGTSHPRPNEHGAIENDWAIHQLNTTVNFSRKSKWISWYVGGLNFQIEHHLFPKICHVHYPEIAPIVKETAEEFGIPYMENETFMQALNSHVATLQRFGKLPSMNEAIA